MMNILFEQTTEGMEEAQIELDAEREELKTYQQLDKQRKIT